VLVVGFPAGSFATNCYLVAPGPGSECVVVDPGLDAVDGVERLLREHRLKPVAVVLTHGHVDHTFSVVPLCDGYDIPAYLHPDDRHQLTDPASGLGLPPGSPLFGDRVFREPDEVRALEDGQVLRLAGVELRVDLAPGHTPGSVVFSTPGPEADGEAAAPVLFSGDLLFAGSIGRTDLPGGSHPEILESLARVCLPLPDETPVLPGHGPATTIGRERLSNPFLVGLTPGTGPFQSGPRPPSRGL
jgi:hydroxyacylglutathione hydrolase